MSIHRTATAAGTSLVSIGMAVALAFGLLIAAAPGARAATSTVEIQAPSLAALGVYNWLTASVTSSDGTTRPAGGVQFLNSAGQIIATASLSPSSTPGSATASAPWVPTQLTTYAFTAVYNSTTPGLAGATTSQPTTITTTPNGSLVQIAALPMTLGVPSTLVATVFPANQQGSVAFSANGYPMSASIPIVDGRAEFTFVPRGIGWQRFDVSFSALGNAAVHGGASQWVQVTYP